MFGHLGNLSDQMKMLGRLMKDEKFRAVLMNPKVQELMRDPEFLALIKSQDMGKMMTHPRLAELMRDPELSQSIMELQSSFPKDV